MNLEPDQRSFSPRTYLFVPGDRPERFGTAWESSADAVILDLEDAVPPDHKPGARQALAQWLSAARPVWIRINAEDTAWFLDDLELLCHEGVAGVLVPKAEALPPAVLDLAVSHGVPVMPIVETAIGMRNAERLATSRGVARLAFGAIDFQVDMGIEGDDDALLFFRSTLCPGVTSGRAASSGGRCHRGGFRCRATSGMTPSAARQSSWPLGHHD